MATDIKPGTRILVTLKTTPSSEAAAKTLSRLFLAAPANKKARLARKKLRANYILGHQRGGRTWFVRPKAPRIFQPVKGDACTLVATTSVLRDLGSVARHIDIKPAR